MPSKSEPITRQGSQTEFYGREKSARKKWTDPIGGPIIEVDLTSESTLRRISVQRVSMSTLSSKQKLEKGLNDVPISALQRPEINAVQSEDLLPDTSRMDSE